MSRYKILIEYDGTGFHGWQKQKNSTNTVQETIENAFSQLTQEKVSVYGAGRTDTGVHATEQTAHIDLNKNWPLYRIQEGLNYYLKNSKCRIIGIDKVSPDFHARFHASLREYKYLILNRQSSSPIYQNRMWHIKKQLDIESMQQGAKILIGTHNFNAFRSVHCQAKNPFRSIESFEVTKKEEIIKTVIQAKSFLQNQVRIMMGTLVEIGLKKISPESLYEMLKEADRKKSGPTAPPYGLYLNKVFYS